MKNISIRQISNKCYILENCDQLPGRQAMKFNIFLNSLADADIEKSSQYIIVTSQIEEKHAVSKLLKSISDYLSKQGCPFECDESVSGLIDQSNSEKKSSDVVFAALKAIKANTEESKDAFEEFCHFCDSTLRIKLRPYQYKAAYLLSVGKGGFDFSVPGAGKTIITYAAYAHLKTNGIIDHIFVIGPGSSYNAWFDEFVTCFGKQPDFENLAEYTAKDCRSYLEASPKNHKEISFINLEKVRLLTKDVVQCLSTSNMLLVIDEAHKIKNPNAAVTKAVLEITKHAHARIILTGTPMPNGYEDLHSLVKTFSPFEDILPYNYNQLRLMTKNDATESQTATVRERLGPYYSRISKKYLLETKELLPPNYHMVYCQMSDDQRKLYDRLNTFFGKLNDDIDEDILLSFKKAILIRKMQISANPSLLQKSIISSMDELRDEYAEQSQKADSEIGELIQADRKLIEEFSGSTIAKTVSKYSSGALTTSKNTMAVDIAVELVSKGQKVLIWDIFVKNMDVLKALLEARLCTPVEMVNGSVTGTERQGAIRRFREGSSMVLLANPATLAESISLHKVCQNAIYVNRNFNAAQFIQSKDRIHRINMPVGTTANYYFLLNSDSVDDCVNERLAIKENRMLAILDADDIEIGGSELEDGNIMSRQDIEESFLR